ncbi:MAG: DUF6240 domain-containing protein, partial [Lachnospiraceae bacterium]|nr:DUF6240 domain-containing protein [Lachnospiraceae bacterium]
KDRMTLLAHTMSPEAYREMGREGFDPAKADPEDAVNIVDEIKATMAKSGVVVAGYNDDLSMEELTAITGSEACARELERAFREQGVPLDKENAAEGAEAVERLTTMPAPDRGAKDYLIENGLPLTTDNLYRAEHSGAAAAHSATQGYVQTGAYVGRTEAVKDTDALKEQIAGIVEAAGETPDEENMALAQGLTGRGLPLTPDSFLRAKALEELKLPMSVEDAADAAVRALADGMHPSQAQLDKKETLLEEAKRLSDTVQSLPDSAADAVADKGLPLTIKNLSREAENAAKNPQSASMVSMEASIQITVEQRRLTARRQLEEVRLSMTVQVSYRMLKSGVNVDTTELSNLVDQLKAAEDELRKSRYNTGDSALALEREELFGNTQNMLRQLPGMPVSILGERLSVSYSMESFVSNGQQTIHRYEEAGISYEAMRTEYRPDLGDNITKAFAHADSLLKELGIDATEENLRATRVLGYNSMEVTQENIDRVKEACGIVDNVIDRLTPATALQMIREGRNPLKMSMEELDTYLQGSVPTGESYSQFLVRMETKNRITAEERESYIGIHRLLHQVKRRDGAAVGTLIEEGRELSFENLLGAIRSRKSAGMDVRVDDALESVEGRREKDIAAQIETAMYKDAVSELKEAADLPPALYEELMQSNILPDAEMLLGLQGLRERRGELFDISRRAAAAPHRRQYTAPDGRIISTEGNASDDALSVTKGILEDRMQEVLDRFDSREEAGAAYETFADAAERILSDAAVNDDGSIDLRVFAGAMKQLGCARALAREESYEIPMTIHGQESSVSVSIRHEEAEKGTADITLRSDWLGNVHARFVAGSELLRAYVTSDSPSGRDILESLSDALYNRYDEAGIPMGEISFVYSAQQTLNISRRSSDEVNESFDTATLYRCAKIFLQTAAEV